MRVLLYYILILQASTYRAPPVCGTGGSTRYQWLVEFEAKGFPFSRESEACPEYATSGQATVCVIEENGLAAEYVRAVLGKERSIHAVFLENLYTKPSMKKTGLIFVLDSFGLTLPVSEYLRQLRVHYPGSKYVVLGRRQSDEDVGRLLWFGIHAYLDHSEVGESLVRAIHAVFQGAMWAPEQVLLEYIERITSSRIDRSLGRETLTPREYQVTELAKRRFSNKEIAIILKIREGTVKFHLSNIFSKLRVTNRHDLLAHEKVDPPVGPQNSVRPDSYLK